MSAAHPIGSFRHRLMLEAPVDTADDNGGVSRGWSAVCNLWASIEPQRLAHRFAASREEQTVTHHIVIRRRAGMTAAMRLRRGEQIFRILALEDADPAASFLRALCEEIKP